MEELNQTQQSGTSEGQDNQLTRSGDINTSTGVSVQLAPDFSSKLIIVEDNDEGNVSMEQNSQAVSNSAMTTQSAQVGDEVDSVLAASTIANASEKATAGSFVCSCGENFEKSVHLAAHKRWSCKLREKTVQCEICKHWFAREMGLRRHMKHAHGGMFSCDGCSLRFHNKIKLTRHWLEAHLDESDENSKKLKCYECGDTNFDNKFELECHLVLHKYEKRQQKIKEKAWWSSSPHGAYSPYPPSPLAAGPPPFAGRPPFLGHASFPGHPPFSGPPPPHHGFGPRHWGRFGLGHPPRPPFPFMHHPPHHHPPHPFPSPSSPQARFPENIGPSASQFDDESSVKSSAMSSTVHGASTVLTEDFQANPADESEDTSTLHPHHNHDYAEATAFPYYCQMDQHYLHHHHLHHQQGHHHGHGKIKWKKYLKLMKKGQVPPFWPGMMKSPKPADDTSKPKRMHRMKSSQGAEGSNTCQFKIACQFCDKVIERDKVGWHQRKECPVLSVHRCSVCDRVFRKRHFLIKHMQECNHYVKTSSGHSPVNTLTGIDANTLSSLQEKMNASLNLITVPGGDSPANSETSKKAEAAGCKSPLTTSAHNKTPLSSTAPTSNSGLATQILLRGSENSQRNDKENRLHGEGEANSAGMFQCRTCKHGFQSVDNLKEHLREHINQVLAIQKVREWRNRSSEYFLLGHDEGEDGSEGTGSFSTATSLLDSEITSATGSVVPDISSNFSSLETTESKDSKWMKPHKKRSGHRHKGEIMICEFCGDKFAFMKDLHFHMETKHKDSTLQCPICRKKFSWKKRGKFYERHLNSHYGVKVFKHKCEVCGKTFLENSKLRAHMSLHNNELLHKCSVCGKGYANKSSLVRHERKHNGVKPYQCDICKESFSEKRELLRHSTTHTGVAPFSCEECGQGFTLKTSLVSHMRKKHSKNKEK